MLHSKRKSKIQAVVRTLIKSRFYFDLSLRERHDIIYDIMRRFPTSLAEPMVFQEKNPFLKREK